MPTAATSIAAGSSRATGLTGAAFGSAGGAFTIGTIAWSDAPHRRPVPSTGRVIRAPTAAAGGLRWLHRRHSGDAMPDALCRVTVHARNETTDRTVDLALPNGLPLAELMRSVVELLHGGTVTAARWRLRRICGEPLDESLTLAQNQVHDGDVLWLTVDEVPPPVWFDLDAGHTIAGAVRRTPVPRGLYAGAGLGAAGLGAAALLCSADATGVVIGGTVCAAAVAVALVAHRMRADRLLPGLFGVMATLFAAATGAAAVPGGAAQVMLAASAASAVSVVVLRCTGAAVPALTAVAVAAVLVAGMSAAALAWPRDASAAGALLAVLSLAVLGAAPRLSIAVARVGPDLTSAAAHEVHELLSGIAIGAASAAAAGALLTAGSRPDGITTGFAAVVGVALLLRTRVHADTARRCALAVCGFVAIAGAFVVTAVAVPQSAHWLGLVAVGLVVGALSPLFGLSAGPGMRRSAEVGEYVVLAAVIPLACWIAGLYGAVRGLALT
ncbi:type VII secretion integral membrane protein EccD [Mycolicibacterium phlei]